MRIAICFPQIPFMGGGAALLIQSLRDAILTHGYDVDVIRVPFKWYPPEELIKNAITWRLLDVKESDGNKIDVIICTKFPSYFAKHDNKIVWLFHQHRPAYDLTHTEFDDLRDYHNGEYVRKKIRTMDTIALNEAKKIYCISANVAKRLLKFNSIRSEVLYPPVPNAEIFSSNDYNDYVLCPSRISPIKRQDLLVKAMHYTKTPVKCKIVGFKGKNEQTKLESWLNKIVQEYKVEGKVEFVSSDSREELARLYSDSLAVFFAPYDEDYGFVTLEAFLSEKPIITTEDSGGVLEFVDDKVNGFITASDPKIIASKIDYLYQNKDITKNMGKNGRAKIQKLGLSWDNVIKKLVNSQ